MTDSPHIVALDEENFMQVVVEGSDQVPVLVDFWAEWCGPCKALMPLLEKLAVEYNGAFILAKLDTEAHPGIAQQLGIRSLPTVKLFRDRQLVDEFMGALPEAEIREFLTRHVGEALPAEETEQAVPEDTRLADAMALFESGQAAEARQALQLLQAEQPEDTDTLLALGQVSVSTGDLETATSCLKALPETEQDSSAARRLGAIIELAGEADHEATPQALKSELESVPDNSDLRYRYALASAMAGNVQEGMDNLMIIVQRDPGYNEGAARLKLLAMFNVLGDDPLVSQYRRKLFALLH